MGIRTYLTFDGLVVANAEDALALWNDGYYGTRSIAGKSFVKAPIHIASIILEPNTSFDFTQTGCSRLSWNESVYIQERQRDRLAVSKDEEEVTIDLLEFITKQDPEFRTQYTVFRSLRQRGWIVKSGLNYGTNFILYKGSPELEHAEYAVTVLPSTDRAFDFRKLLGLNRSCIGAKKTLVVAIVKNETELVQFVEMSRFLPEAERTE